MHKLKFVLTIAVAFLLLKPNTSFAGGTVVGDGGHSVQCKLEQGSSFQLLDIYQAQTHFHFGTVELPVLLKSDEPTTLILRDLSQQLGTTPTDDLIRRAVRRAQMMESFIIEEESVSPTQDNPYFEVVPANCEIKQLGVTRISPEFTNIIVVAKDWQRLDSAQRALFLLHEALHFDLQDPEAVRQVVAYMAASPFFQASNLAKIESIFASGRSISWDDFVL